MDSIDDPLPVPGNASQDYSPDKPKDDDLFSLTHPIVDVQELRALAAKTRQSVQPGVDHSISAVGAPIKDTSHIIFSIEFEDGVRWHVKIPVNGVAEKWDQASAAALTTEANTMRLLKRETKIPIPEVLGHSSTTSNAIKCPYIIMENIEGLSLYDVWFGHQLNGTDTNIVHSRRVLALNNIASAMLQLGSYEFGHGGSIEFDWDESPSSIGPVRLPDGIAALNRRFLHGDLSNNPTWTESAACSDTKKFYSLFLDLHPETNPTLQSVTALLRRFIEWIPEPNGKQPFVLAHPEFDLKNFIVSEEGHLRAIIGWSGVMSTPQSIGNEKYPRWLIRDWDPATYGDNNRLAHKGDKFEKHLEDAPEELKRYRCVYDESISKAKSALGLSATDLNLTRMSIITDNLMLGAQDPHRRNGILKKIIQEISSIAEKKVKLEFTDLATTILDKKQDEAVWVTLEDGFKKLLVKSH